ncbi:MAG: hypothetical protein M3Y82_14385 [Verrucomicrobiota bacterium]|nr:hypothetical protein [Verrucomicrobiota bacterium]
MPKRVKDEFSDLPMSRQLKYQKRKHKQGKCTICGQPKVSSFYCLKHLVAARERQRVKIGCKRRSRGMSYRLEEAAKTAPKQKPTTRKLKS